MVLVFILMDLELPSMRMPKKVMLLMVGLEMVFQKPMLLLLL